MKIELWPLARITPYERNPRVNDCAVDAVARSLQEFGFRQPIVVDPDGVIICGHTRYKAAHKLGLDKVPVHVAKDLSPEQIKAYRIADNQTASLAEWDFDLLPLELAELHESNFDLGLLGFDQDELAKLLNPDGKEGLCDPDDVPAPPDAATTQPGDLWILGNHRLLCGDSSKPEDVDRLLDGQPIHLVNTDPPYNVKVEPRSNNAISAGNSSFSKAKTHHQKFDLERHPEKAKPTDKKLRAKDRPLANDFVSDEEFDRLLDAWFGNMSRVLVPGRGFYIWGGYANCANYPPFLKKHELYFSQAIIWVKGHPVLTRKDFMGNHEWCQPPDTAVMTPVGSSSLGALRSDDRVVSFYQHNSSLIGLRDGFRVDATNRHYSGTLYGVAVDGLQTWTTAEHLWTGRLAKNYGRKWCTYLMRRGRWYRIGCTKLRTTWGFGLKGRLVHEGGDEAWILGIHDEHADARLEEQLLSVQHGIPMSCWAISPNPKHRQWRHIEYLYEQLDPSQQQSSAINVLRRFGRLPMHPYVHNSQTRAKFGSRQAVQMHACNVIPEITEVPIAIGGQATRWRPVKHVDVQPYEGPVCSLGVDVHRHYIADGIVTHNCFYGWKQGAAHQYYGPNNATDVWSVKKINPQSMVHLTEKPVELAVLAMQYSSLAGEHVLDLFGGSGSTLIAAEQTGRKAFLMELDPLYADVIVQRYEQFTGTKAERVSASEVAA